MEGKRQQILFRRVFIYEKHGIKKEPDDPVFFCVSFQSVGVVLFPGECGVYMLENKRGEQREFFTVRHKTTFIHTQAQRC